MVWLPVGQASVSLGGWPAYAVCLVEARQFP
jgi:hypothetical protein